MDDKIDFPFLSTRFAQSLSIYMRDFNKNYDGSAGQLAFRL